MYKVGDRCLVIHKMKVEQKYTKENQDDNTALEHGL